MWGGPPFSGWPDPPNLFYRCGPLGFSGSKATDRAGKEAGSPHIRDEPGTQGTDSLSTIFGTEELMGDVPFTPCPTHSLALSLHGWPPCVPIERRFPERALGQQQTSFGLLSWAMLRRQACPVPPAPRWSPPCVPGDVEKLEGLKAQALSIQRGQRQPHAAAGKGCTEKAVGGGCL